MDRTPPVHRLRHPHQVRNHDGTEQISFHIKVT